MNKNEVITASDIQELLLDIGIPTNLLGFSYITSAIQLSLTNVEYTFRMTKLLYIDIAKKFNTSPASVERCIRHAIEVGWNCGSIELIEKIFRNSINSARGIPTNSQFITRLCLYFETES